MLTIYLVSFFFIGLLVYGYRAKSKNEIIDFAFSSRQLTTPALIATLVTTWYGGINEIGIEVIHNGVVTWVYFGLFYYISALVYAFYIAPKILKKNHSSLPILIFETYGKKPALILTLILILYLLPAPYLLILGQIISQIFNINLISAIIIGLIFSTIYTLKGGFKSIIRTDQIQFIFMFLGFIILFITLILSDSFGIDSLKNLIIHRPDLFSIPGNTQWSYIFMFAFLSLLTFLDPSFYQRTFSGKNIFTVKKSIVISVFFWFLFDTMTISIALIYIDYAISNGIDPKFTTSPYVEIAKVVFFGKPIFMAIFFISLLSVVMSTIDSYTFLAAYTFKHDLNMILGKKTTISDIRLGTLIILILSFILTQFFDRALYFWYYFGGYLLVSSFVPLICALFNVKLFNTTYMIVISLVLTLSWDILIINGATSIPAVYIGLTFSFLWALFYKFK